MNKYRDFDNYLKEQPDQNGYFGKYGGNYLEDPELIKAFNEYAEAYNTIAQSAQFIAELRRIRRDFQGRPTPVYHCQNLSNLLGRTQIYLSREDLNHTGAHKLNHCMGEGLLAKYMGKKKLIAFAFRLFALTFLLTGFGGILPVPGLVFGVMIAAFASLPMAILGIVQPAVIADIAEADKLDTGESRQGMFFAARTFDMKLGQR